MSMNYKKSTKFINHIFNSIKEIFVNKKKLKLEI